MDIKLTILSLDDAKDATDPFTHVIQILDVDERSYEFPRLPGLALRMRFEDESNPEATLGPELKHIQRIAEMGRLLKPGAWLASHCYAGRSRSTAAALIALVAAGLPPTNAVTLLGRSAPDAAPNRLMMAIADEHFGLVGELVRLTAPMRQRWA